MAQAAVKLVKRFNPNKPHATCHGDPRFAYEQNGIVYNGQFQAVTTEGKLLAMEEGPPPAPEPQFPPTKANKPQQRQIDPEDETEDEKALDLLAWRDGKLPGILWPKIVAEVKAQLGRSPSSKIEALEMINKKFPPVPADAEPEESVVEA